MERASQQGAWYDDQPYNIGDRVEIVDPAECAAAGGSAGRVVGYDASGPRRGENFIRVLVLVDGPAPAIVALPPHGLAIESGGSERTSLARTMLVQFHQSLGDRGFARLREWLRGEAARRLLEDPGLARRNVRIGPLVIPGLLLPEMVRITVAEEGEVALGGAD